MRSGTPPKKTIKQLPSGVPAPKQGRAGTLSDLLDEIPVDAARFFFNSRAAETQMEFDLDLAV